MVNESIEQSCLLVRSVVDFVKPQPSSEPDYITSMHHQKYPSSRLDVIKSVLLVSDSYKHPNVDTRLD